MEPLLGQIQAFGFNFAPRGWTFCDGQLLPISQHQALFSLLGTTYGGDGRTTFALPDLRGRVSMQFGQGPGLSNYTIGQQGGAETVTLGTTQIPSHTHTAKAANESANSNRATGNALASPETNIYRENQAPDTDMHAGIIGNTGGGQGHTNIQPFLIINWCIALTGTFPSRN